MKFHNALPLIDESQVDEIFARSDDEEGTAMQLEIWNSIKESFLSDLETGLTGDTTLLRSTLHRIRGYAASAGAQRLAELLLAWEKESDPVGVAAVYFEESKKISSESFAEIEKRHPYLIAGV